MKARQMLTLWSLLLIPLLLVGGCNQSEDAKPLSGRCYLTDDLDTFLCIEFPANLQASTGKEICDAIAETYETSGDTSGRDFVSGFGNRCKLENLAGSCKVDYGTMRFYDPLWTAGDAEFACATYEGDWTAP